MAFNSFTSNSVGTGNFTFNEDVSHFLRLNDQFIAVIDYDKEVTWPGDDETGEENERVDTEFETADCTYLGNGVFSRDAVDQSSSNNQFVDFPPGLKTIDVEISTDKDIRNEQDVLISNGAIGVGANMVVNTTSIFIGNSTVNAIANSSVFKVTNATSYSYLTTNQLYSNVDLGITANTDMSITTITGRLYFNSALNLTQLKTGSAVDYVYLRQDTHGDAVDVTNIAFYGKDSAGNQQNYGGMICRAVLDNAGAAVGDIRFTVLNSGSVANGMSIGNGVIIGTSTTYPGIGKLRTTSILFAADTAAANELDDYEEGSWTPSLTINSSTTGITYASRSGAYTKIGNLVSCRGRFTLTNNGSSVGLAQLFGFPFTAASGEENPGSGMVITGASGLTGLKPMVIAGQAGCNLVVPSAGGDGYATDTTVLDNFDFALTFQYRA